MAVFTELTRAAIARILEQYDVGALLDFREIAHGIENTNYFVRSANDSDAQTDLRTYVLTLVEGASTKDRSFMVEILDACFAYGLPVAPVLRTKDGAPQAQWRGHPVLLSRKLPGQHVSLPVTDQCGAVGRFLARLHRATAHWQEREHPYERDVDWLNRQSAAVAHYLADEDRKLVNKALSQVKSALTRPDLQCLPQAVIHGDLFRDNVLFNQYGLTGAVDFHHSAVGYCLYDITVAVNDWCRTRHVLNVDHTFVLLREYNKIRPLVPKEYWFFPIFLTYAALCFWLSRLIRAHADDLLPNQPIKDPHEFAEILRNHILQPFRITELALGN